MRELVSCRHCKPAGLMAGRITPAEVVHLVRHLAECRPDDRSDAVRAEDTLRHFRRVAIEESPVNNLGGSNERT